MGVQGAWWDDKARGGAGEPMDLRLSREELVQ